MEPQDKPGNQGVPLIISAAFIPWKAGADHPIEDGLEYEKKAAFQISKVGQAAFEQSTFFAKRKGISAAREIVRAPQEGEPARVTSKPAQSMLDEFLGDESLISARTRMKVEMKFADTYSRDSSPLCRPSSIASFSTQSRTPQPQRWSPHSKITPRLPSYSSPMSDDSHLCLDPSKRTKSLQSGTLAPVGRTQSPPVFALEGRVPIWDQPRSLSQGSYLSNFSEKADKPTRTLADIRAKSIRPNSSGRLLESQRRSLDVGGVDSPTRKSPMQDYSNFGQRFPSSTPSPLARRSLTPIK